MSPGVPGTLGSVTMSRHAQGSAPADPVSRRLPAEERREQLFEVALRLFGGRGFAATTMDDIASAAGVTKPLLYQHFTSKRALYLELVDSVAHDMLVAIGDATSRASGPRQQVEAGFAAYFELVVTHQDAFRLLFGSDVPDDPELSRALRRVEDTVAEAVGPLIDAGLDPEHRRLIAYAVVGMATGASRHWLASTNGNIVEELNLADEDFGRAGGDSGPGESGPAQSGLAEPEAERLARRVADLAWAGLRSVHRD
jgi:AcrR family transcriptional regulator